MKVRAKRVEEKYEALLDQLYGDTGVSEWNLDKDEAAVAIEIQKKGEEKR
ncbi:hypothetical protein [Thermoactinomyces daqus]|nr:hypothetical protein [Thermoactinomyces daqus]